MSAPIAPLWRRFAALIYDSLIVAAIAFAYSALLTLAAVTLWHRHAQNYEPMFQGPLASLGLILSIAFFYSWFWHKSGQTVGMRAWRIRVVQARVPDEPPSWRQCFLRCLAGIPSLWLLGAGYLYRFFDSEQACLHDRLSGTRVVVTPKDA